MSCNGGQPAQRARITVTHPSSQNTTPYTQACPRTGNCPSITTQPHPRCAASTPTCGHTHLCRPARDALGQRRRGEDAQARGGVQEAGAHRHIPWALHAWSAGSMGIGSTCVRKAWAWAPLNACVGASRAQHAFMSKTCWAKYVWAQHASWGRMVEEEDSLVPLTNDEMVNDVRQWLKLAPPPPPHHGVRLEIDECAGALGAQGLVAERHGACDPRITVDEWDPEPVYEGAITAPLGGGGGSMHVDTGANMQPDRAAAHLSYCLCWP